MAVVHREIDASGRYIVQVEDRRSSGFPSLYRLRVIDRRTQEEVTDDEVYHSDADAACEGWAVVSALLARSHSSLQGAYIIGQSEY